jgi:hypothetical protein
MSGFLSAYEGTERIDLGSGYWADVKLCLSTEEYGAVEGQMGGGKQRVELGARQFMQMDIRGARVEMVVRSLVDWNLDDPDGTVWDLTAEKNRRANVNRLPAPVFDQIWKKCDELNGKRTPAETATFPDPADGSDPVGAGLPGGTAVVPA